VSDGSLLPGLVRRERRAAPCEDDHSMPTLSKNLRLLADYSERMVDGDFDAVYEVFSEAFFSHVTQRINPEVVGADIRPYEVEFWQQARAAFSELRFMVNLVVEHDDLVVSNWTMTGVHDRASFYDIEASGKAVEINGTTILRIEDGRVVEHWGGPHCAKGIGLAAERD
jgi:predicted ester cyclase